MTENTQRIAEIRKRYDWFGKEMPSCIRASEYQLLEDVNYLLEQLDEANKALEYNKLRDWQPRELTDNHLSEWHCSLTTYRHKMEHMLTPSFKALPQIALELIEALAIERKALAECAKHGCGATLPHDISGEQAIDPDYWRGKAKG